jgi:hypothetical protein
MLAPSSRDVARRSRRSSLARAAVVWAAVLGPTLIAAAAGSSGCSGDDASSSGSGTSGPGATTTASSGGGSTGSGGGGGGGIDGNLPAKEYFLQAVLPGMVESCVLCHATSGIADFLLGATPEEQYASITAYKSGLTDQAIVWPIPEQSVLYTYPDSPDHNGTNYGADHADLKARVLAWLTKEAANLPPAEEGPIDYVVPFKPIIGGLNAIYLDPLGDDFKGSAITFVARELGSPPSILELTKLEVYPAGVILRFVHPLFSVYPGDESKGYPDPADSFSDLDQTFVPQEDPTLGTGQVLLTNWEQDARLALDFSRGKIETQVLGADGGVVVGCNALDEFQAAVDALGNGGPKYCAETCHGGARAEAQAAMDLSGLVGGSPDYGAACAAMRARITPGDVESSQIVQVTNPQQLQVVHMYKFQGNLTAYKAFKTGMTPWIMAE